jgi:hypothetical protein
MSVGKVKTNRFPIVANNNGTSFTTIIIGISGTTATGTTTTTTTTITTTTNVCSEIIQRYFK